MFYSGLQENKEHAVGFLFHREIAGHVDRFLSIHETASPAVIKLNRRYRLLIAQANKSPTSCDGETVHRF